MSEAGSHHPDLQGATTILAAFLSVSAHTTGLPNLGFTLDSFSVRPHNG